MSRAIPSVESRKTEIFQDLQACRRQTLAILTKTDPETFCQQGHEDFSPVGWHLGHIAFTEAYWILERCAGLPPLFPQYQQLFAADGLPKAQRQKLPSPALVQDYLHTVREKVLTYLEAASLEKQEPLWCWLIQHESQHGETMAFLLQLLQPNPQTSPAQLTLEQAKLGAMVEITGGAFKIGSDRPEAQDNESPSHWVYLPTYWIDAYPVTCAQYGEFMAAGGYQRRELWSEEGWRWLQANPADKPLYWRDSPGWEDHPACGVSYYEAEAYAQFVGKRLPTEAEWEKAASWDPQAGCQRLYPWGDSKPNRTLCHHDAFGGTTARVTARPQGRSAWGCYEMLGNVWEWTASWFAGYEGFQPHPYAGYSQAYFDNQHRVLRGGSWASRPWALRNSFRNWYHPWVRQVLAGFRCAS